MIPRMTLEITLLLFLFVVLIAVLAIDPAQERSGGPGDPPVAPTAEPVERTTQ